MRTDNVAIGSKQPNSGDTMRNAKSRMAVIAITASVGLSACGGSEIGCSNEDVLENVKVALVNEEQIGNLVGVGIGSDSIRSVDPAVIEVAREGLTFGNVVVTNKDESIAKYSCEADVLYSDNAGNSREKRIAYDVQKVESGDSDFEISYDSSAYYSFGGSIYMLAAKAKAASDLGANPPKLLSDDEVRARLDAKLLSIHDGNELVGEPRMIRLPANESGLPRYAVLFEKRSTKYPEGDIYYRQDSGHFVEFIGQVAGPPGGVNALRSFRLHPWVQSDDYGYFPESLSVQGDKLLVLMNTGETARFALNTYALEDSPPRRPLAPSEAQSEAPLVDEVGPDSGFDPDAAPIDEVGPNNGFDPDAGKPNG